MKVEIYSDIVCPWCYIGERRFARALQAFGPSKEVEVVFRPYQLDPTTPAEARPLKGYLQSRYGASSTAMLDRVTETGAGEGITFDWDNALSVNTVTAHRLMALAEREYGPAIQGRLAEELFELYFARGGDVSDHEVLAEAAVAAGMDADRVRSYLASGEGLAETEADLEHARQLGITAVPTFVFDGKYAVQGAQSVSTFLRALEELEKEQATSADTADDAENAACDDGSCVV